MTNEQKEGVIIVALTILVAGAFCLLSDWGKWGNYSILSADIVLKVFHYEVTEGDRTFDKYPLIFKLSNVLYLLSVPLIYGALRATGIVKRLFSFESVLTKLVPTKDP